MNQIKIRFGDNFAGDRSEDPSFEALLQSTSPVFCLSKQVWKPQMDIFETDENIIIQAEVAGVDKDDINIEVSTKAVKISGIRRICQPNPTASYRLAEIQYGRFERVMHLPAVIDVTKVSTHFNKGFLELTMAKLFRPGRGKPRYMQVDLF